MAVRIVIAVLIACAAAGWVLAVDPGSVAELESKLAKATAAERLPLLTELAAAVLESSPERAAALAEEGLDLSRRQDEPEQELAALRTLGIANIYLGDYAKAEEATRRCAEVAEAQGAAQQLVTALINLGAIYRNQGRYDESLASIRRALEVLGEGGNPATRAAAFNALGVTLYYQGNLEQALAAYHEALKLREARGDLAGTADLLNNIAVIHDDLKQVDVALDYYRRSLETFEQLGDQRGMVNPLNNLAVIAYSRGELETAERLHRQALAIRRALKDRSGEAASLNNLGNVLRELGDPDGALLYYQQALAIRQELGDRAEVAVSLRDLGDLYRARKQYDLAQRHVEESLAIAREIDSRTDAKNALADLSQIHAETGRFERALELYRQFNELENALQGEESAKAVAEAQARYESEKKEQEILVLKSETRFHKRRQVFMVAIVALLAALSAVILNRYRLKLRANRLLEEKNAQIEHQRARLAALNAVLEVKSQEYYASSIMDQLTGTYNKAYILDTLEKTFSLCLRYRQPLACVFFDLDHFKRVNDTHGHLVGDQVLARLAATALAQTRKEDILGRYGGEEFLLVLPNTGLEGAKLVAEKVRSAVEAAAISLDGLELRVTVSLGVAEVLAHGAASPSELLRQADTALYRAKEEGRNRSVVFSPPG